MTYRLASPRSEDDDRLAPRESFELILKYVVIPTIDLIVDCGFGIILVRRTIPPYRNRWALPGLRILKGDDVQATVERVAALELGIAARDLSTPIFIDQQTARFKTEMNRQDLSSTYAVRSSATMLALNAEHYSAARVVRSIDEVPSSLGGIYAAPLQRWFSRQTTTDR